jgi:SET domain-containing protein
MVRFLYVAHKIDVSSYSMITSPGNKKSSSRFLMGPVVLINNSCNVCENITLRSDNKTLISHLIDFRSNFTIKNNIAKGEELAFSYSLEIEDDKDEFKFNCIKCGK